MDTIELTLSIAPADQERYVAWLEDLATGFVQKEAALRAYVPAPRWTPRIRERVEARLAADGYADAVSTRWLAAKNWNAVWEETLSPVRAGPFLICPASVDVPAEDAQATVLRIDPQMSFGTGHHATTRLALHLLAGALESGDRVLDVGTGTGVLAIASCRSGAASVLAVDTKADAVRNARENVVRNEASECVTVREGSLEVVPTSDFDVVLANITRGVLLELLPDLVGCLKPPGTLILSGVLERDQDEMVESAASLDLTLAHAATEEGWWGGRFLLTS